MVRPNLCTKCAPTYTLSVCMGGGCHMQSACIHGLVQGRAPCLTALLRYFMERGGRGWNGRLVVQVSLLSGAGFGALWHDVALSMPWDCVVTTLHSKALVTRQLSFLWLEVDATVHYADTVP